MPTPRGRPPAALSVSLLLTQTTGTPVLLSGKQARSLLWGRGTLLRSHVHLERRRKEGPIRCGQSEPQEVPVTAFSGHFAKPYSKGNNGFKELCAIILLRWVVRGLIKMVNF